MGIINKYRREKNHQQNQRHQDYSFSSKEFGHKHYYPKNNQLMIGKITLSIFFPICFCRSLCQINKKTISEPC